MVQKILYICTGNRFRSMFAEAYTNASCSRVESFSRGTDASEDVLNEVRDEMQARALWSQASKPRQLEARDLEKADLAVCMKPHHRKTVQEKYRIDVETVVWQVEEVSVDLPEKELRSRISSTFDRLEDLIEKEFSSESNDSS